MREIRLFIRMSRGLYEDGKSLFDDGNIIHVVANVDEEHWFYAYVVMSKRTVVVLDSISKNQGENRSVIGVTLMTYLEAEFQAHHAHDNPHPHHDFDMTRWKIRIHQITVVQKDKHNCGIYATLMALRIMSKIESGDQDIEDFHWDRTFTKGKLNDIRNCISSILQWKSNICELFPFTE